MPADLPKTKVDLVLRWACPHCQYVNIQSGSALDDETKEALAADDENPEEFGSIPSVLFCRKCEGQSVPENIADEEEDDDDV